MKLTDEQVDRLERLAMAWADAEQAVKIGEQVLGDVVVPAIKELRYAGRKLSKSLDNYIKGEDPKGTDRVLEDAIFDCFRARHDATDAATAAISLRLEHAINTLGYPAVREHFSEYAELRGLLSMIRKKVAAARQDQNGRHDIYEDLEIEELPKAVALYEQFLANEPHMKDRRLRDFLKRQGITWGFFIMLALWVYRLFFTGGTPSP